MPAPSPRSGEAGQRAAQYLRMSRDHQRYSMEHQAATIALYAAARGYELVSTYPDAGVSGITIRKRAGLQRLLADVVGGAADFEVVLIYDISRWGRFQNPDESAHYEFVCRQAGVRVEYCAEDFGDGGLSTALLKQVKRVMAADYSAHLSKTVRHAKRRNAEQGFWPGGEPGYGLRRCVVDDAGRPLTVLRRGEPKTLQSQRMVLVPGPEEEVAVVRRIYRLFLEEGVSRTALVRQLNDENIPYGDGRPWTYQKVKNVLTNPAYAGDKVFGRYAYHLGGGPVARPPEAWVRIPDALPAAVPRQAQTRAATIIANRMVMLDDEAMLARLADLLNREGRLTSQIIKRAEGVPCPATYHNRFGSLREAYRRIGYVPATARGKQSVALARTVRPRAEATPALSDAPPAERSAPTTIPAVAYLRISAARRPESIARQQAAAEAFARAQGYGLLRTYADRAISGVDTARRPAFRELLGAVLGGRADFAAVLVYDVSRWGRFQDPDEAAHYEFLFASEGVRIVYFAEAFAEGEAAPDVLMKSLKRAMAAEFSRDLGAKVARAQARLSGMGHWQHGPPGYALRRRLMNPDGTPGTLLKDGQRKSDPRQHTVLVKGPAREVAVVRRMHRLCGAEGLRPAEIAEHLNREGVPAPRAASWSAERVRLILANPKYAGVLVTGRRHTPLGGKRKDQPPQAWITAPGASPALVSSKAFAATQAALRRQAQPESTELLEALRAVANVHGVVGEGRLKALGVPHYRAYRASFGSLRKAFAAIGCTPGRRFPKRMDKTEMLQGLARLFERAGDLTTALIDADPDIPSTDHYRRRFGTLAEAFAQLGFVRIGAAEGRSPVGRARLEARRVVIRRWSRL
ncbi:recombinase family protein [Phenylobacterium sp.]|uniref:recombinase family protein n=1 Tax=Phenylobacterium sp. TaxID=1871053 RepID=UPI002FCA943F